MKSILKFSAIITFLIISLSSCSSDDDNLNLEGDINPERFENMEIGSSSFQVPQFSPDLHVDFDYTGKTKVKKIYFDINPINASEPNAGEMEWNVSKHLVPEKYYKDQLNPNIHYHMAFDPANENKDFINKIRPAEGTYNLKITVIEEDNSESLITKEFEVVKKFLEIEIGHDYHTDFGSDKLHTDFMYDAGNNTVSEVKYVLWFKEWRDGENKPIGKWDSVETIVPNSLYQNQKKPEVHYDLPINPDYPKGTYWLNIYVKESGEDEAVKLSVPFDIE
ncbi:hypothetical protein [Flavivirga eckloniae]|uniref:DUF4625 domain-containing protein n=1 Tax=Flavivirga eckloniae TaxID=1803846 RepID=A0A2K9PV55_9FLAO|nr:hypothetical protein [Flavivirga eckloniae]AUP80943.1 hypothetical protein C1H87_20405 [Flavivirga eckloniae]